jgi:hypothetical protein
MSEHDSSYFNTTALKADPLKAASESASKQNDHVLAIFHANGKLTPSQAWSLGLNFGYSWLLTSVRRSITTLTNAGQLVKLEERHVGPYGRPETVWAVAA